MAVIVTLPESPLGETAFERAIAEASMRDLPVVVAANVAMPRTESGAEGYHERRQQVETQLDERVRALTEHGLRASAYLPSAPTDTAYAVLQAAEDHDAELIVIGIRRRSPVGKVLLGSVAQDILLGARCPVLGVKLAEDAEGDS
jgi:nucleotide-binding universal stress UspA family protein